MAQPRRFGRSEPLQKSAQCSCGAMSKLIQRCNYPFGRNSTARRSWNYVCKECHKSTPLSRPPQARRGR